MACSFQNRHTFNKQGPNKKHHLLLCPVVSNERVEGGVHEDGNTDGVVPTDLGELLNLLESFEIDSQEFFEELPNHGVLGDSDDEESSDSDGGSDDYDAGYINGDSQETEDKNGEVILRVLCLFGWSWILSVFLLGMPFLISTLSVAMMVAMGSKGVESRSSLPNNESSTVAPSVAPDVAPSTVTVTSAGSPAFICSDLDIVASSAGQGHCIVHNVSEDKKIDIHENIYSYGDTNTEMSKPYPYRP